MYHSHQIQNMFWRPHRIQLSGYGTTKPHAA
jgi:hypothetical protein